MVSKELAKVINKAPLGKKYRLVIKYAWVRAT